MAGINELEELRKQAKEVGQFARLHSQYDQAILVNLEYIAALNEAMLQLLNNPLRAMPAPVEVTADPKRWHISNPKPEPNNFCAKPFDPMVWT